MTPVSSPPLSVNGPMDSAGPWLVVWAMVVFIGLFSFYVHLLHEQVDHGERLRQQQRGVVKTGRASDTVRADEVPTLPTAIVTANLR